jgi:(p)ppGpp synthase/HD superfamily hydrolase
MLLAMARDVRVILIKLADRLAQHAHHGGRCRAPSGSALRSETLDIYAPIAHRLGLNQTYRELQELCFRLPAALAARRSLSKAVTRARGRRRDLVAEGAKRGRGVPSSAPA